jgi:mannose-6-phosphate isomerase-like protein (cupin superfamily)
VAQVVQVDGDSPFRVVAGSDRSQAAEMALPPGASTGGPDNRHDGADQWVFVVSGTGSAVVDDAEYELSPGTLLLIEAGEAHELRSAPDEALATLNIYAPPEYGG